ncbi:hypothetical protein CGSMWGv6119V5_04531 [Gardnerella vaginalis 6119V5]|nr:hypothetical protein CGSMWGv6119V5_04531 [Gardnerella vaginalis 6119V5]
MVRNKQTFATVSILADFVKKPMIASNFLIIELQFVINSLQENDNV